MAAAGKIFHPDFKASPYWWEAWAPGGDEPVALPAKTDVAIVGGGYAGLSAALELARSGTIAMVIEANAFGHGASTRSGGHVGGGVNIAKGLSGRSGGNGGEAADRVGRLLKDAAESLATLEMIIAREHIECLYEQTGRFVGAYCAKHYDGLARRAETLNRHTDACAAMVPRGRQREEIASDFYYGGMTVRRSGKLHPALYYKGLLEACRRQNIRLVALRQTASRATPHLRSNGASSLWRAT